MSSTPRKSAYAHRGFTLVELVVVVTIIAILAGALVPTIVKPFMHERRTETIQEMEAIEEAILGRPDLGDWGYLSTIGQLPTTVSQLLAKPGSWSAGTFRNAVPRGWNGPYVQIATQNPTQDAWGNDYIIETNPSDPSLWRLQSWGPNRVPGPTGPTNDDIFFPSATGWYGSTGSVQINLVVTRGNSTAPVEQGWISSASLHVPINNGASDDLRGCAVNNVGQCTVTNVPIGLHALQIDMSPTTGCTVGVNCTVYRPVKVIKPTNVVEVTIPNPTAVSSEVTCSLINLSTAASTAEDCATNIHLPPGGRVNVTVTGALQRTSGGGICYVAAQTLDVNASTRLPTSINVASSTFLAVSSQSSGLAPVFTSRTFENSSPTNNLTIQVGALLAASSANCQFVDGKVVAHRWGSP